jgi:hypothetical protein
VLFECFDGIHDALFCSIWTGIGSSTVLAEGRTLSTIPGRC